MERPDAVAALARAGSLGPFFAIDTSPRPAPDWRPVDDLYRNRDGRLDRLIATFGERLSTTEPRVAASIFFQGYAARLWSPLLGCIALGLPPPDLPAQWLYWRYRPGEPLGLLITEPSSSPGSTIDALVSGVLHEHLRPMVAALRSRTRIATNLLWGNAASALAGTLTVLRSAVTPVDLNTAQAVATKLLDIEPLRGTWTLVTDGGASSFRRRSCCLYYRVPGGGLCGDCSLRQMPKPTH